MARIFRDKSPQEWREYNADQYQYKKEQDFQQFVHPSEETQSGSNYSLQEVSADLSSLATPVSILLTYPLLLYIVFYKFLYKKASLKNIDKFLISSYALSFLFYSPFTILTGLIAGYKIIK